MQTTIKNKLISLGYNPTAKQRSLNLNCYFERHQQDGLGMDVYVGSTVIEYWVYYSNNCLVRMRSAICDFDEVHAEFEQKCKILSTLTLLGHDYAYRNY